jgi:hypothetical protein
METVYIQFDSPGSTTNTNDETFIKRSFKKIAKNLLTKIIPVANPDFGDKIENVKYWLIECDLETGIPQREVGLDEKGNAILKMPYRKNYGYWTDNNLLLDDFEEYFRVSELTKEIFEEQWNLFKSNDPNLPTEDMV